MEEEEEEESLSFAAEVQNPYGLAFFAALRLIVCAADDVLGLCAGRQIGVGLVKELCISTPTPLFFIYTRIFYLASVYWELIKTRTTEHKQREGFLH